MVKWFSHFLRRPVWYALLLLFGLLIFSERALAAGVPKEALFQLSIEANKSDPRLCLFVVTAADERLWSTLINTDEEQFQRVLSLKRETQSDKSLPAMLGRYQFKDQRLEFKPAFPLVRGGRYQAVLSRRH